MTSQGAAPLTNSYRDSNAATLAHSDQDLCSAGFLGNLGRRQVMNAQACDSSDSALDSLHSNTLL